MGVDEILVHIAGPSSTKDDSRFREMALAYDRFEAVNSFLVTGGTELSQQPAQARTPAVLSTSSAVIPTSVARNNSTAALNPVEYIESTPLALAALESQLLTSSLAASQLVSSPLAKRDARPQDIWSLDGTTESEPFHTPQPVISISSTDSALAPDHAQAHVDEHTQRPAAAPVSAKTDQPPATLQSSPLARENARAALPASEKLTASLTSMPDIIVSPSPPASLFSIPTTHLTHSLRQLAENLDISVRFKPLSTSRPLRPSERGYWWINTHIWSSKAQADFWSYLVEFLGSGAAGWGVSAYREPVRGGGRSDDAENIDPAIVFQSKTTREGEDADRLGIVRIYCWGEVVGHIYLVAFVASWSKIKQSKAQWIDADGETIIQMP